MARHGSSDAAFITSGCIAILILEKPFGIRAVWGWPTIVWVIAEQVTRPPSGIHHIWWWTELIDSDTYLAEE